MQAFCSQKMRIHHFSKMVTAMEMEKQRTSQSRKKHDQQINNRSKEMKKVHQQQQQRIIILLFPLSNGKPSYFKSMTNYHIKDCTLPFAGIILGPPSSLKTVTIDLLNKSKKHVYHTHNFSPRSLVSHISGLSEEELQKMTCCPRSKTSVCLLQN